MRTLQLTLRGFGLGKALYQIWHRPRAAIRQSKREGGLLVQWRTRAGQRAMQRAARLLPQIPYCVDPGLVPIHFLTGARFWYQTAFCIWSYAKHARTIPRVVIHDDGSLTEDQSAVLRTLVPGLRIITLAEAEERLGRLLPENRFPELNKQWRDYINIRKLIGVHLGGTGWKLVLDSDMLFHSPPVQLLEWQRSPSEVLVMQDAVTSYGYESKVMEKIVCRVIPELINVGVTGLHSENIPWHDIEKWCQTLITDQGPSYFLEQALIAMLASLQGYRILDSESYRLVAAPGPIPNSAALYHYVDLAKGCYFQREWSRSLRGEGPP